MVQHEDDEEAPSPVPAEEEYVDRRWSIPKSLWDQVLEAAAATGINFAELVVRFLEDGLKMHMREPVVRATQAKPKPAPDPWTVVYVEEGEKVLGRLNMRQVPSVDEILTVDGSNYVVRQRAWTAQKGVVSAYLRVEGFAA
jgi:hypothetical protein